MLIGHTVQFPRQINYYDFLEKFVKELRKIPGVSLMLYGSVPKGNAIYGLSDIDAVLKLPGNFVIEKSIYRDVSKIFAYANRGNNIELQVNVIDERVARDGRFLSYDKLFEELFRRDGKVLVGEDPRNFINYAEGRSEDVRQLAFNLRLIREVLLEVDYLAEVDPNKLRKEFRRNLQKCSSSFRVILREIDSDIGDGRFDVEDRLKRYFPNLDLEQFYEVKKIYTLESLQRYWVGDLEAMIVIMFENLEFVESLLKEFILMKPI